MKWQKLVGQERENKQILCVSVPTTPRISPIPYSKQKAHTIQYKDKTTPLLLSLSLSHKHNDENSDFQEKLGIGFCHLPAIKLL